MGADTSDSLESIRAQRGGPIFLKLLEIQKHKNLQKKSLTLIKNLECLYVTDSRQIDRKRRRGVNGRIAGGGEILLGRRCTNAFRERNYVAVSYTWDPSKYEGKSAGGYYVESRQRQSLAPSKVRDVVLDRVAKYVTYCKRELFWIDRECIDQDDPRENRMRCNPWIKSTALVTSRLACSPCVPNQKLTWAF